MRHLEQVKSYFSWRFRGQRNGWDWGSILWQDFLNVPLTAPALSLLPWKGFVILHPEEPWLAELLWPGAVTNPWGNYGSAFWTALIIYKSSCEMTSRQWHTLGWDQKVLSVGKIDSEATRHITESCYTDHFYLCSPLTQHTASHLWTHRPQPPWYSPKWRLW